MGPVTASPADAPLQALAVPLPSIEPPEWPADQPRPSGGLPPLADRVSFIRALTVLRHLLHHPFDQAEEIRIDVHLARCLNEHAAAGSTSWTWRQVHAAISDTLPPYGFRLAGTTGRHGYALGTALLPLHQLVEAYRLLQPYQLRLIVFHSIKPGILTVAHDISRLQELEVKQSQPDPWRSL